MKRLIIFWVVFTIIWCIAKANDVSTKTIIAWFLPFVIIKLIVDMAGGSQKQK
jgi:hypothetical protein